MLAPISLISEGNPLTFEKLLQTIGFQVGLLGTGLLVMSLVVIPKLYRMEAKAMSNPNKAQRALALFPSFTMKGVSFILLTGTLGILLTDVGWVKAFAQFPPWLAFLMARASGAPNGAHLLSYIPLPVLGLYVAFRYRKDLLLDCFQGILLVAFGVAVHETIWLGAYWAVYAKYWNLATASNTVEDFFFFGMCLMFVYAFWKFPYRMIPMKAFKWPVVVYSVFMFWWYLMGVPVTTINNWQLGATIYMVTPLWADPFVNAVEIFSWNLVAALFFLAVRQSKD